ncbi:nostrin isoform X1 [Cimex lectularius]|uniref:Nostrin n=2 Tax=Cimex lectularius TaxID=79782 RepID=A0A8I6RFX5_CIMLE|nr:nostrin isoform X1 [Cimex lectularius]
MSWFASFVNVLVNGREAERRPEDDGSVRFPSSSSETDSFDDSDDEVRFADIDGHLLEEAEDLEPDDDPIPETAIETYQDSDSEGVARSTSPAAVYATVSRPEWERSRFEFPFPVLELRGPTPPEPDFPEYEPSKTSALGRQLSSLALPETGLEKGAKRLWGSFQKLATPQASRIKRRFAQQPVFQHQGQSGFEDLRRHVKQGGDFSKELASILQERSEAEAQYAKLLARLSAKLAKATKELSGTVNSTWHRIGIEMENESEIHRSFAASLTENLVKPLRSLTESQHRIRKSVELAVDKSAKNLAEWRAAEAKAKKHSFVSARDNEKLRDGVDVRNRISGSSLHISKAASEKDTTKLESKRKKAEETVKKADVEYYNLCLRAERSRLEWESAIVRGSHCFEVMEDERLKGLRTLADLYAKCFKQTAPKLTQIGERISDPLEAIDVSKDMQAVVCLRVATEPSHEQILPDFYPEQLTLAMNRDRRRQAIIKLLQLVKGDLERERRGKAGVENLVLAFKQTPTFTSEDSQHNVTDKLQHMKSMLAFLEATRYKLQSALAEIEGTPIPGHPLAPHIHISRDRQGYRQSTLKVPSWVHDTASEPTSEQHIWIDRGTADGTATHTDSDFDEFSSQGSEKGDENAVVAEVVPSCTPQRCKALYNYKAKLYDELDLTPGDIINIHDKQVDGWWLGELNGTVGIFPATYVEEL